ncbi:MAG: hypothetical protein QOH93_3365 [Chloroflexia bacterium]|jgi:hypothetical protein|nr:hypothetical protein [Chloroflexia bacterium]
MANFVVKVVCGTFSKREDILAPGRYWTAVNIYNLNHAATATLNVRLAIAEPAAPGPTSHAQGSTFNLPGQLVLKPEQALEIDCDYIMRSAREVARYDKEFLKGFIVIRCNVELDIVAVYTAAAPEGNVVSFQTQHVASRVF